mgnify:CR=1 FL=1
MNEPLAIIIPAYKSAYLREALSSLAGQTDRSSRVYIGDDASPENLRAVVDAFAGRMDLRYTRFDDNAGGRSLVEQWNRCVRLSSEPWVWLFSDDDTADPGCVAAWRNAATGGISDVFRFNTRTIDGSGAITRENPAHPAHESGFDFAVQRMSGGRLSYGCEYIFARAAFDFNGGFVDYPLAWCSDDASWIAFSRRGGIATIEGPRVNWRYSGDNLSSVSPATRAAKREALLRHAEWLRREFGTRPGWPDLAARLPAWFRHQLGVADCLADTASLNRLRAAAGLPPTGRARTIADGLSINARILKRRARKVLRS